MSHELDKMARTIFTAALREDRAGELLEALFDDGAATVDATTGKLVIISQGAVNDLASGCGNTPQ